MKIESEVPQISADDFARRFALRAGNLMWLLGAGASASAGVPTADDMIWEFKQKLFVSQRKVSPSAVSDLSSPSVRLQLQAHIDSLGNLPPAGSADEYAALFEVVYPSEMDRRAYLDSRIAGAKPSYGHFALATLMRAGIVQLAWSTNFDPLLADACANVYGGTGALTIVALDAPDLAAQRIADGRWPVEVKLHGDFRSRRLKNTDDELRHQDTRLRQVFVDSSRRFGLVVVGYSGRDVSIMETLEEAVDQGRSFPAGLFWLHRGDGWPSDRVTQLIVRAKSVGIEAALVPIENFDETMRDVVRLIEGIDTRTLDAFALERPRWSPAPCPEGKKGWPVIRLNALQVVQTPSVCRRVVCRIGGHVEVLKAVQDAQVSILFARKQVGVLAFGADADVRSAFQAYGIEEFDLHTVDTRRLRYESAERGLLRNALSRAIARHRRMDVVRRRSADLLAPCDSNEPQWEPLREQIGTLSGTVGDLTWREGVSARLDWADDRLWLVVDPCIVFDGMTEANRTTAADFARERTVKRYNRQLNGLIACWSELLAGQGEDLRALATGDGVDAVFKLSSQNGFSRRVGA